MNASAETVAQAVGAICPDIAKRVSERQRQPQESDLWFELSCCLLSSQVPYSLAVAAAEEIRRAGSLVRYSSSYRGIEMEIRNILSKPLTVQAQRRKYRFPKMRAEQLATTRMAVSRAEGSLLALLSSAGAPSATRAWFVENAPGMGPKQTSMFLRNAHITYDLAIIDRHVLNYMVLLRLIEGYSRSGSLRSYQRLEEVLLEHAAHVGVKVGILDWAIWIVMRLVSASEKKEGKQ